MSQPQVTVEYGESNAYELGVIENTSYSTNHSVTFNGLVEGVTYHYRISVTDHVGFQSQTDDLVFTFFGNGPVIDVWNGLSQTFGSIGQPQRWVNVLGNVSDPDGLSDLTFSLNGELDRPLSVGPFRRLENAGDFNVEIDYAELLDGTNYIDITAVDGLGNVSIETVIVEYEAGNVWPLSYEIAWDSVAEVTDVAQVVDGKWEIVDGQLRPAELGY